jgi:hypothetical protein
MTTSAASERGTNTPAGDLLPLPAGATYEAFLNRKSQLGTFDGFEPLWLPNFLFPFQRAITEWAIRKGKSAIIADCGMGKTPMELVFAQNVILQTNGRVLIACPLAVSYQFIKEGEKFGIEVKRSIDGTPAGKITVTNYERLHLFNPTDYEGFICDEASILKNFDGVFRQLITDFMRKMKYRLLGTATAAPNDYIELGTMSESLGELGYLDMLNRFFRNEQNTIKPVLYRHKGANFQALSERSAWRFKKHAEIPFWRWVCSWARAIRKPSDLGFDDGAFVLPPLVENQTLIENTSPLEGELFVRAAIGLEEQRQERRITLEARCEKAAELVNDHHPAVVWCHLNPEGDLLEKLIPGSVQVAGSDSDEKKEEALLGFSKGDFRVLVTKQKIAGWGLNWQHCAHMTVFTSHSFEAYYQGVRRCWRFGQTQPVIVDVITTKGEETVLKNLQRKSDQADRMFSELVKHMNEAVKIDRSREYTTKERLPSWL